MSYNPSSVKQYQEDLKTAISKQPTISLKQAKKQVEQLQKEDKEWLESGRVSQRIVP